MDANPFDLTNFVSIQTQSAVIKICVTVYVSTSLIVLSRRRENVSKKVGQPMNCVARKARVVVA